MDGAVISPVALRAPAEVMRLARMGAAHPTRLSFMRILLRRLEAEGWCVDRPVWEIGADGVGHAVYSAKGPERSYSLVAFAHDLSDEMRSDRVIAEAWDATFALFDGSPSQDDIARLSVNVPRQEAGRVSGRELTLSRANRSVRLFEHVIERLAIGRQPDAAQLDAVGYLMRTTAVYGSGKFGLCDREVYAGRPELRAPFQAEMLTVWLIRAFTVDLVEHLARARNPAACRLDPTLKRGLGVGNSTGLGMAPFLLNHPVLIHQWMHCKEQALVRVRSSTVTPASETCFRVALDSASRNAAGWVSDHPVQREKLAVLRADLERLTDHVNQGALAAAVTWDDLWRWGEEALSPEGQEQLLALMLEPHGDLIDALAAEMSLAEDKILPLDGTQILGALRDAVTRIYGWALATDWSAPQATARLWYVSAEKLEPRLAERREEPLEDYEQPLAPGRDVAALSDVLIGQDPSTTVCQFLREFPEHRFAVARVQTAQRYPYSEVRDNTIAAEMLPIDLLRAKLSFFGATRFDPRSDRWVRISMFQGAPYPEALGHEPIDAWMYGG